MTFLQVVLVTLLSVTAAHPNPDTNNDHPEDPFPLVHAPIGKIQGLLMRTRLDKTIFAFRGMRYAKAPVHELRFKGPEAIENYEESLYNATVDGPMCPQPTSEPTSEDCLMLNVYSTKIPKSNDNSHKKPVIVYFHGGGFSTLGAVSTLHGPEYWMDKAIVLVTVNFRVGPLGFLSTGDKEAPGNYGLKDQAQALKWVNQNIAAFGGDPELVTILGYGTGGRSATLHMVSPMTLGLFQRVIAMSGSSFGNWPLPPDNLDHAKKLARILKCPDDSSANIIKCIRGKSAAEISDTLPQFKEFGDDPIVVWSPVIEGDFGQKRFVTAHPVTHVHDGKFAKVPFLTGINAEEFAPRAFAVLGNETLKKEMDEKFEKIAPIAFMYERDTDRSKIISKEIKSFYLNDKPLDKSSLAGLAHLYSDALVGFGVNRAAKLISEKMNESVYYYKFTYQGRYSHFYTPDSNSSTPFGVVHSDDLMYLFYMKKLFPIFKGSSAVEIEMVNKLTSLFSNFAKTGNPTPDVLEKLDKVVWQPYKKGVPKYLEIGNKLVLKEEPLFEKRYGLWEKQYPISSYSKNHIG